MSKHSDYDDSDLSHEPPAHDPLAEVYTGLVTPDIENINERAAVLEEEGKTEPDRL